MRKARFPFPSKDPVKALTLLLLAAASFAADKSAKIPEGPDWIPLDDPKLQEVLAKIEAAGAYDVPALEPQEGRQLREHVRGRRALRRRRSRSRRTSSAS